MKSFIWIAAICFLVSCSQKTTVDLLVYNAKIYTVDSSFSTAEAMAVKDGKIVETGTTKTLTDKYETANKVDAQGKFIYPGFIDAHAHFYRYGLGLQTADLVGTTSWEEIIQKLQTFNQQNANDSTNWLIGRGWDQNDWQVKEFPSKEKLDEQYPNKPVLLTRVDGHAAIANQRALDLAGIRPGQTTTGGTFEVRNGKLTGILIDNAIDLVSA
ncbi:MAG: amidohydrolase, partial [Chitinophagaceae bacterium]